MINDGWRNTFNQALSWAGSVRVGRTAPQTIRLDEIYDSRPGFGVVGEVYKG